MVLSHWLFDWLVHVPDLTLWGTPPKLGLGLWNHPAIAMPLELGLTFGALVFYLLRTRATSGAASPAAGILAALLLTIQAVSWFGPAPEAVTAEIPLTALAAYTILALVAAWVASTRAVQARD